jgi:hypothetical protein
MLPEDESVYGEKYGAVVKKPDNIARVSLCDVTDDRILSYLEDSINESDFQLMGE